MYPQRKPVHTVGKYTVHEGKLARDDARSFWIEGPAGDGVLRPLASFWFKLDAIRRANEMDAAATPTG